MTSPTPNAELVEEIVRRYLARVARRYSPFVIGVVTLLLVVTLVPTVSPTETTRVDALGPTDQALPETAGPTPGSAETPVQGPTVDGSMGGFTPGEIPPTSIGGPPRVERTCSRRQFSWSANAPCFVAFSGSNGGGTWRGVTAKEIIASFRISNSGQAAAVESLAQGRNLNQGKYLHDLRVYLNYFNSQFQLYGRKVALKVFTGQGDWVAEYQGQNLEGAQADAATARDLGAFIDISTAVAATSPAYADALASVRVISAGGVVGSQRWFERHAPYNYSTLPTWSGIANFWGSMACQRMAGLPAIYAGDAGLKSKPRVFGIYSMETPDYAAVADALEKQINGCSGGAVRKRIDYNFDLSVLAQQAVNAVAQFKENGVTTVICLCDTVTPTLLSNAAKQQLYFPEFMNNNNGDDYGQQRDQDVWAHALLNGGTVPDPKKTEAYRTYKRADPNGEPQLSDFWLPLAYYSALLLFDTLQTAGPHLTPTSYMKAAFSLPPSLADAELPWRAGRKIFTPASFLRMGWWDRNRTSPSNGKIGTSVTCAGKDGAWRPIQTFNPKAFGPKGTQPRCFGT